MNTTEIKFTQERIGAEVDGFWGSDSAAAAKSHLAALKPSPNPWPTQSEISSGGSIFGDHGVDGGYTPPMKKFKLPFELHLYGDHNEPVTHLSPHEECSDSLLRVFEDLAKVFPDEATRKDAGVLDYFGCYAPRPIRGGSSWSMHSWAIAIDLDANRNQNSESWAFSANMSILVMECFAREGWLSAGSAWARDAMHAQSSSS